MHIRKKSSTKKIDKCRCCTHEAYTGDTVLVFDKVNFMYNKGLPILENVNLKIEKKSNVCIIGPNGSGKTTALKLILGLLQPVSGTIKVFDVAPHKSCIHIGYVPQYTRLRPAFPVTVYDIVMMGCVNNHFLGWHRKDCKEDCMKILNEVEIFDIRNRSFSSLSGGQRQRVLIARALVAHPQILLLDEPTANVDPVIEQKFRKTIKQLSKKMTVITVSHDLDYISDNMDQVIFINRWVKSYKPTEISSKLIWQLFRNKTGVVKK